MTRRPELPDIRELTEQPARDRRAHVFRVGSLVLAGVSFVLLCASSAIAWNARTISALPDALHAVVAGACVLVPSVIAVLTYRREGIGILPYVAIIAPLVTWLCVCCLILVGGAM